MVIDNFEFKADNDNNIVDLPCAENHHYMHRGCYNDFIKENILTSEIKNDVKRIIFRRKIARGLKISNLIGFEDEI